MQLTVETRFASYATQPNWRDGVMQQRHLAKTTLEIPFTPVNGLSVGSKEQPIILDEVRWVADDRFEATTGICDDFDWGMLHAMFGTPEAALKRMEEEWAILTLDAQRATLAATGREWTITDLDEAIPFDVQGAFDMCLDHLRRKAECAAKRQPQPVAAARPACPQPDVTKPWWKFW